MFDYKIDSKLTHKTTGMPFYTIIYRSLACGISIDVLTRAYFKGTISHMRVQFLSISQVCRLNPLELTLKAQHSLQPHLGMTLS